MISSDSFECTKEMSGYCDELFYILLEEEYAKCFDNDVTAPRELMFLRCFFSIIHKKIEVECYENQASLIIYLMK